MANRVSLQNVRGIVIAVENQLPALEEEFKKAQSEEEKVAVGLSFVTHPDFRFSCVEKNRYACDVSGMGLDPNKFGENSFRPWLASHNIRPEEILVEGNVITLAIPHEKNSEIIAKVTDPACIGRVEQCQKRAEYFAKQHPEIPIFITNRNQLPKEMKGELFSAESLSVSFVSRHPSKSDMSQNQPNKENVHR